MFDANTQEEYGVTEDHMISVINLFSEKVESKNVSLIEMPVVTLNDGMVNKTTENKTPCELPFYSLYVKSDGRVTACCADITDELTLGSILQESLGDIISGQKLYELRLAHLDGNFENFPLCLYCGNRTCVNFGEIEEEMRGLIEAQQITNKS